RYQHAVARHRKTNGHTLDLRTQRDRIKVLQTLFRWSTKRKITPNNPAADLDLPKVGRRLPMVTLSAQEVARVLAQPNLSEPEGVRDRSILELMYSTGVRRGEVVSLRASDVDPER